MAAQQHAGTMNHNFIQRSPAFPFQIPHSSAPSPYVFNYEQRPDTPLQLREAPALYNSGFTHNPTLGLHQMQSPTESTHFHIGSSPSPAAYTHGQRQETHVQVRERSAFFDEYTQRPLLGMRQMPSPPLPEHRPHTSFDALSLMRNNDRSQHISLSDTSRRGFLPEAMPQGNFRIDMPANAPPFPLALPQPFPTIQSQEELESQPVAVQHRAEGAGKRKKGSKTKPSSKEGKIPRPPNKWILYRASRHHEIARAYPGISNSQISSIISREWRAMSADDKKVWEARADSLRAEHKRKYPFYKYKPGKAKREGGVRDSVAAGAALISSGVALAVPAPETGFGQNAFQSVYPQPMERLSDAGTSTMHNELQEQAAYPQPMETLHPSASTMYNELQEQAIYPQPMETLSNAGTSTMHNEFQEEAIYPQGLETLAHPIASTMHNELQEQTGYPQRMETLSNADASMMNNELQEQATYPQAMETLTNPTASTMHYEPQEQVTYQQPMETFTNPGASTAVNELQEQATRLEIEDEGHDLGDSLFDEGGATSSNFNPDLNNVFAETVGSSEDSHNYDPNGFEFERELSQTLASSDLGFENNAPADNFEFNDFEFDPEAAQLLTAHLSLPTTFSSDTADGDFLWQ
ncbi:hypothetical protein GGR57DRAFT_511182 [Xylariaceae sp. FL1272]|nr:hypothetical protein GGR57DRAFT_511182 [Xylariaceae sp. FL1272]